MENDIAGGIMPFKIQQLIDVIIEKKHCSIEDAFHYLYTSELYQRLVAEGATLWYDSTLSLYEDLEKSKLQEYNAQNHSSKITLFLAFCLEEYKKYHAKTADDSLYIFLKYDVFKFLEDVYETLHTQGKDYIMEDIDQYLKQVKL